MAALLPARPFRFAVSALAVLFATAGLTSGASLQGKRQSARAPAAILVVPDVRGQAYVFAKGILEESGFAWRVAGAVNGFPINLVATQRPSPGTRVLDTGAPTISLQLSRNSRYAEKGVPENFAPFGGTRVVTPAARAAKTTPKRPVVARNNVPAKQKPAARPAKPAEAAKKAQAKKAQAQKAQAQKAEAQKARAKKAQAEKAQAERAQAKKAQAKKAQAKKARATKPVSRPKPVRKATPKPLAAKRPAVKRRPVAFYVPNAPKEPLDEMPLPRRARLLGAWLDKHPRPTDANIRHWVYQHAWIVTGAKFGWWRGAEALRILIAVDGRVISTWGVGTISRAAAKAALAEVKAKKDS